MMQLAQQATENIACVHFREWARHLVTALRTRGLECTLFANDLRIALFDAATAAPHLQRHTTSV